MGTTIKQDRAGAVREKGDTASGRLTGPPVANASEAAETPARLPLATLLAGNVLQDGELIQIIIKPSRWFIVLHSMLFAAGVIVVVGGLHLLKWQPMESKVLSIQLTLLLIAGRLMWAALQWMGRYYILTNLRLVRLSGIFEQEVGSIALRKVSSVKLYRTMRERLLNKGSIEITAAESPVMLWQTVSRCKRIHEHVTVAVKKAQQNGHCG